MPETSIRRLAMADLDEAALRRLAEEGETLFVERKQDIPNEGLGPTVASFANTLGGWVLLGVADDGTVTGYDGGEGDFVDKLRHKLSGEIDPLPPFAAELVELDSDQVGVIRVFESVDTPHIVIDTGSIFIREPGGKRAIREHGELIELARRGEEARRRAAGRLRTLPFVLEELDAQELLDPEVSVETSHYQFIVRAAPLTVPPTFADLVLSSRAGEAGAKLAREIFPGPDPATPSHRHDDWTFGQRGFAVTTWQVGSDERSTVIADAGGVLVLRIEWSRNRQAHLRPSILREPLIGLLRSLGGLLAAVDARGRVACELLMRGFSGVSVIDDRWGSGELKENSFFLGGELVSPPDDEEIEQFTERWIKEIARGADLAAWQS